MVALNSQSLQSTFHNHAIMRVVLIIRTASIGEVYTAGYRMNDADILNRLQGFGEVWWRVGAVQFRPQKFLEALTAGGRTPGQWHQ